MARPENPSPLGPRLKEIIRRKYPDKSIREIASIIRTPESQMSDTVGGRDIRLSTLWRIGVILNFDAQDYAELFRVPEGDQEIEYMTSPKRSGGAELGSRGGQVTAQINKEKAARRAASKASGG